MSGNSEAHRYVLFLNCAKIVGRHVEDMLVSHFLVIIFNKFSSHMDQILTEAHGCVVRT